MRADRRRAALRFAHEPLAFGVGERFDALALDFRLLQDGGDEFAFAARDFRLLDFHLGFALHLLDLDRFGDDVLLLDVGFNFIGLVGLCLRLLRGLEEGGFLDVEVALRFGLLGERSGFRGNALLIGLGFSDGGGALRFGALDSDVALRFGGGYFGIAPDARHVGAAHVGDVFALVTNFLDGEADDFQPHLAHVVRAGRAHAVAHHFRLFDDLLDGELADDSAEMAFHDQANQAFALVRILAQELLRGGED